MPRRVTESGPAAGSRSGCTGRPWRRDLWSWSGDGGKASPIACKRQTEGAAHTKPPKHGRGAVLRVPRIKSSGEGLSCQKTASRGPRIYEVFAVWRPLPRQVLSGKLVGRGISASLLSEWPVTAALPTARGKWQMADRPSRFGVLPVHRSLSMLQSMAETRGLCSDGRRKDHELCRFWKRAPGRARNAGETSGGIHRRKESIGIRLYPWNEWHCRSGWCRDCWKRRRPPWCSSLCCGWISGTR